MDIQNVVSSYGFNEQGTDFMSTMASGDGMRKFSTSPFDLKFGGQTCSCSCDLMKGRSPIVVNVQKYTFK